MLTQPAAGPHSRPTRCVEPRTLCEQRKRHCGYVLAVAAVVGLAVEQPCVTELHSRQDVRAERLPPVQFGNARHVVRRRLASRAVRARHPVTAGAGVTAAAPPGTAAGAGVTAARRSHSPRHAHTARGMLTQPPNALCRATRAVRAAETVRMSGLPARRGALVAGQ